MRARLPLTRPHPAVVVTALIFVLAGLMFATAALGSQGTDLRAERALELRDLVRQRSDRVDHLEAQVAQQRARVDELAQVADPQVVAARDAIAGLRSSAGLTPLTGRALTVTLDDAPLREPDDPMWQTVMPDDVIVHQADVQAVINALWRGGARGIQVMDQRLINTSSVQCVGNTLLLQGRAYSPPYVITAVGPTARMRRSLRDDPAVRTYRSWASAVGLGYEVARTGRATVPAYTGPIGAQAAVPAAPGSS